MDKSLWLLYSYAEQRIGDENAAIELEKSRLELLAQVPGEELEYNNPLKEQEPISLRDWAWEHGMMPQPIHQQDMEKAIAKAKEEMKDGTK